MEGRPLSLNHNTSSNNPVKALGLCSGGLDSILSALVLRRQGIHVEWISFETPFFTADKASRAARQNNIPLHTEDITESYLELLKAPPAGFGKNMNPCMDCHALMFQMAGRFMEQNGFNFLFSGEVRGQRPMSQNANSLRFVEKHSGYQGQILRPLSAKCLAETPMERNGLVDRDRLCDFSGRSRKPQIQLAKDLGVREYPSPAGGCLLTDPGYARRLKDLYDHLPAGGSIRVHELHLLKYGRHMRLGPLTKLVVGRTQKDNENLLAHHDPDCDAVLKTKAYPGPTVVVPGSGSKEMLFLAATICAGYSKSPDASPAAVQANTPDGSRELRVLPITPEEARRFLLT
jgi:tRNA U34 2-thiouridine synthase MnmA/TrmU